MQRILATTLGTLLSVIAARGEQNCLAAPQQMEWPNGATLITLISPQFQPMPLLKRVCGQGLLQLQ